MFCHTQPDMRVLEYQYGLFFSLASFSRESYSVLCGHVARRVGEEKNGFISTPICMRGAVSLWSLHTGHKECLKGGKRAEEPRHTVHGHASRGSHDRYLGKTWAKFSKVLIKKTTAAMIKWFIEWCYATKSILMHSCRWFTYILGHSSQVPKKCVLSNWVIPRSEAAADVLNFGLLPLRHAKLIAGNVMMGATLHRLALP